MAGERTTEESVSPKENRILRPDSIGAQNDNSVFSDNLFFFFPDKTNLSLRGVLPQKDDVPARRSACLRRSGYAQAGVTSRRRGNLNQYIKPEIEIASPSD